MGIILKNRSKKNAGRNKNSFFFDYEEYDKTCPRRRIGDRSSRGRQRVWRRMGSKIKTVFWSRKIILKLQQFKLKSEIKNLENSSLENLVNKNTNFCSDFCIYSVLAIYLRMPSRI